MGLEPVLSLHPQSPSQHPFPGTGVFKGGRGDHGPDCGDGVMGVHASQFIQLCNLNVCNLLYVNYISLNLSK